MTTGTPPWPQVRATAPDGHHILARQGVHLLCGAGAFFLRDWPLWMVLGAVVLGGLASAGLYARYGRYSLLRDGEGFLSGAVWYAIGLTLMLLLFRDYPQAAFVGWLILSVGDSASTLAGTALPLYRYPGTNRSLGGTLGFIAAATLAVGFGLWWWDGAFAAVPWARIAIVAAICAAAEVIVPPRLNDNLYLPILGAGLFLLLAALI